MPLSCPPEKHFSTRLRPRRDPLPWAYSSKEATGTEARFMLYYLEKHIPSMFSKSRLYWAPALSAVLMLLATTASMVSSGSGLQGRVVEALWKAAVPWEIMDTNRIED